MNTILGQIIESAHPKNPEEAKSVLREQIQHIVLIGLSRAGFFSKASFYGGTALRIFYGLNRYSEDLGFTLNAVDPSFSLRPYLASIVEVAASYGLTLEAEQKEKKNPTPVESAFAKLNTYQAFLSLRLGEDLSSALHKDEVLKVKFEVDTEPALGFGVESRWIRVPEFASVVVLDEPSLFAGKLHAVLCQNYRNTVKGRDYYDYLFYIQRGAKPNLSYLRNKLIGSGHLKADEPFDENRLKEMLRNRF